MKKEEKKPVDFGKKETVESLKKETVSKEPVQKGYNEKNPAQPQGAFPADSKKTSS